MRTCVYIQNTQTCAHVIGYFAHAHMSSERKLIKMAYDKVKYNNEYNKEKYEELRFRVAKGQKEIIENHWKQNGYKSFAAYMIALIEKDMNGTPGIQVNTNKGIVAGTIHGDISMK